MQHTELTISSTNITLEKLENFYRAPGAVLLNPDLKIGVDRARAIIEEASQGSNPVYGVNTGFGKLAQKKISPEETSLLQRNLILSHSCGVGHPMPIKIARLMMLLKLLSLTKGASGVRWEVISLLVDMLNKDVIPYVPAQGSVGASGDLAPLAHMTCAMMGVGDVYYEGKLLSAEKALQKAGLRPIELGAKEGLALINGTQFSTAYALAGFFESWQLVQVALISGAMSTDAAMGSTAPFRPEIHELRGHNEQSRAAHSLRSLLDGSVIRETHRDDDERVQDPYCLRCQPQVMGACLTTLKFAAQQLEVEANAVTDNPLVVVGTGDVISGGNFHAEPVALVADHMAVAIAEIGAIAQRRIAMLVDPALNFGLPAFLSPAPGVNSGFMIAEVTSAALMSENKQMASPCSVDSTPTSANQEDHVSMAAHGARRLMRMTENLANILGIELLTAAQGIELRTPLTTSPALEKAINAIRAKVPSLGDDRYMADDLREAATIAQTLDLNSILDADHFPKY